MLVFDPEMPGMVWDVPWCPQWYSPLLEAPFRRLMWTDPAGEVVTLTAAPLNPGIEWWNLTEGEQEVRMLLQEFSPLAAPVQ